MSAVEIRRHLREFHLPHSLPQRGEPLFVEGAHRPREVPVDRGVVEVQRLRAVVAEDPGHHGPLGEIVEASPGSRVEVEEVVQIRHRPAAPSGGGRLEPADLALQQRRPRDGAARDGLIVAVAATQRRGGERSQHRLNASLPLGLRPQLQEHRRPEKRPVVGVPRVAASLEEHLESRLSQGAPSPEHRPDPREALAARRASPGGVVDGLEVDSPVRQRQYPGFPDQRAYRRRIGLEAHGLRLWVRQVSAVEHRGVLARDSQGLERVPPLGRRRDLMDGDELPEGLEHLSRGLVREIEAPRAECEGVRIDRVVYVASPRSYRDRPRADELEGIGAPAQSLEPSDGSERELEHGDDDVVRVEQDGTAQQPDATSQFAVAVCRGRGARVGIERALRSTHRRLPVPDVVLALVQVEEREPPRALGSIDAPAPRAEHVLRRISRRYLLQHFSRARATATRRPTLFDEEICCCFLGVVGEPSEHKDDDACVAKVREDDND